MGLEESKNLFHLNKVSHEPNIKRIIEFQCSNVLPKNNECIRFDHLCSTCDLLKIISTFLRLVDIWHLLCVMQNSSTIRYSGCKL